MAEIVDTLDELTAAWFTEALRAGGALPADGRILTATSRVIGTGQVGRVALAELESDADAPASVIVKLPNDDAGSRQMGAAMGLFDTEVRFYHEIAPRLGDAAIPHMHWGAVADDGSRFTLVIDDLSPVAEVGDMLGGGTVAQAELVVTELARIHAATWDAPDLADRAWLSLARTEPFFAAVAGALEPFVARFGELVQPDHLALAQRVVPKAAEYVSRTWKPPFAVVHGDFRLDNVMFGRAGDAPVTIIDWQAAKLGPPGIDAATYLGSCLSVQDRRAHEDRLISTYHDGLVAAGVTGFSRADAQHSYRVGTLYPFLLMILASVMLVQTERGDEMWANWFRASAGCVLDAQADELLA